MRRRSFGRRGVGRRCGVAAVAAGVLAGVLPGVGQCRAAVTVTAVEAGGDVVFSGGGTLDLSGLSYNNSPGTQVGLNPSFSSRRVFVGDSPSMAFNFDRYSSVSQPAVFGTGGFRLADLGTGDRFGVQSFSLYVPQGYESGASLAGSATYLDETLATLGLTPGTYVWTWGSGGTADSLTLSIVGGAELVGDFNGGGQVEQGDLDLVLSNWGQDAAGLPASWVNHRPTGGIVDQAELDDVLSHWGGTGAPDFVLRPGVVPEPAGFLAMAGLGLLIRTRNIRDRSVGI